MACDKRGFPPNLLVYNNSFSLLVGMSCVYGGDRGEQV